MTWYRVANDTAPAQRDIDHNLAARMPFLLDDTLASTDWVDRHQWNVRRATPVNGPFEGGELLALSLRMERILVTRTDAFLDDARFSPATCSGVIVASDVWGDQLDEFLITVVGLLGPFRALYHGVKVQGTGPGGVTITAPAGRTRRVTRRFLIDREGLPLLTDLHSTDGRTYGYPGYRRSRARTTVSA